MKFSDQSIYNKLFKQVKQKLGDSKTNYIKIFQNANDLAISVGNSYSEHKLMHTFLYNFHKGGKYPALISIHKA